MEDSARTKKIISQAAQWNFEGDCSLLAWMQDLSQNLEQRASATSDALQQLAVNVNRTAIALDNAANSLTALQYTQFVESRCHDDDETLTNTVDTPVEVLSTSTDQPKTTSEVLETFLRRNLQMLNNCHEKYSLDFDDSDEDETATTNNCIYQPKNPYNDALLPHIYGSKLWKEHWHVGLCDGSNEYSGDEASDAFSESSRSSAADNESYESNTANLSEWASSTSIPIEHKHPTHVVAQNVPALPTTTTAPAHNKRIPVTQHFPSNEDSDTCSTTSRSAATNPPTRQTGEHDLFATLRSDTPATSTSASSSPHQQQYAASTLRNQRNVVQVQVPAPSMLPPFFDATPPTDIFDEAATTKQSSNRTSDTIPQRSAADQGKVKPVNLFDDDDFNSFMTDVVEKPQIKADQPAPMPVPAVRNLPTKNEAVVTAKQAAGAAAVDLFADSLNNEKPVGSQPILRRNIEKPTEVKQRKPVNLFDSPENSPPNDSLFSPALINEKKGADVVQKATKPSITAKSLFDDDEDDDDFLNVFGSKKSSLGQRSAGKTLLFDDDSGETTQSARFASKLFDDTPPADNDAPSISTLQKPQTNKSITSGGIKEDTSSSGKQKDATALPRVDLFADFDDTIEENPSLTSPKGGVKSQLLESTAIKSSKTVFGNDLFGDEDNDDLDDLFKKQPKSQQSTETVGNKPLEKATHIAEPTKLNSEEVMQQKTSLFENAFEEDELFSNRLAKEDSKTESEVASSNDSTKIVESPKVDNLNTKALPTENVFKSTSLFTDDFDNDANDIFGVKPNTKPVLDQNLKGIQTSLEQETENQSPAHPARLTDNLKSVEDVYQRTPLFEDEVENEESVLFKSGKEIAKDSRKSINEARSESRKVIPSAADESASTDAAAPLNAAQSNAALNENASNTSVTVEQISKDANLAAKMGQEFDSKPAGVQSAKTSRLASSEKPIEHEANNSVAEVTRNHLEFESDLAMPEKITTLEPVPEPALQSTNAAADIETQPTLSTRTDAHNIEYPSIFLDEPPDDDDFFTTLSSNTQPLSVSKLTLDFESDFYEPALPATPSAATASTSTAATQSQKDLNNKQQPSSSDYGGLRLFSEIPPDDDGEDFSFAATTRYSVESAVPNQRLHSIFYDDFSETLEAVQQIKEKQTPTPAMFDDEPPLDRKHVDIMERLGPAVPQANKIDEERNNMDSANQISAATNDNFGSEKQKNVNLASKNPIVPSKDVIDQAVQKQDTESFSAAGKMRSPAGKLQIPNIKINVQALLPGGGGRPSFKKSPTTPEVDKALDTTVAIPKPQTETRKELPRAYSSLLATSSEPAASENILQSVCKTRVRAPVGRRPSTRSARQENYRKSLLSEQAELKDDDDALPQTNAPNNSLQHQQKEQTIASSMQTLPSQPKTDQITTSSAFQQSASVVSAPHANFFEDVDDENDSLFSRQTDSSSRASSNIPAQNANINATNLIAHQRTTEKAVEQARPVQAAVEKRKTYAKDFTKDSDDDADDLFKGGAHAAPMGAAYRFNTADSGTRTTTTTKPSNITATTKDTKSLFGTPPSEDSDEDLFKSSKSAAKATTTTTKTTKPFTASTIKTTTTTASVNSASAAPKATTATAVGGKLDSIFSSDDEDDNFLSNLKSKKKTTTTTLKAASASSTVKPATQGGGGLFSDIESDEDDLFGGGKSKAKQGTIKSSMVTAATKTQLPTQKPAKVTSTAENPVNLADNPLADLLNP